METKFKQAFRLLSMAALAILMAACSDDNNSVGQPTEARGIPFTATLSNGGSATRALSEDGSNINAEWAVDEQVAMVYQVGTETKVTPATVTEVNEGTASISATLDENVTTGTDVTLIYPYSAVNTSGENIGKVKNDVFENQGGTVASISATCDLRQGEGKITLSTGFATLKDNVTMASQIAIWKLSLKRGDDALSASKLDVYFGGMTASAAITGGTSSYFLAVPAGSTGLTILATNSDGTYIYNKASVTLKASKYYQNNVTLTKQTKRTIASDAGEVTLNDGDIVTGTGGANTQLKIANGATVTLAGVTNIDFSSVNDYRTGIECQGSGTIILADGTTNTFKGHYERAAVYIPHNTNSDINPSEAAYEPEYTLTIRGGGTLIADNSGAYGAGIGGSFQNDCGNIVIEGGNITAKGSTGTGIGGGSNGHSCGTITISGGTITATGSDNAAGIGSGENGSCGDITISGGTITTTSDEYAAGIGSGNSGSCGAITISGGTITATGGRNGAGIGGGSNGHSCGTITISGGTINATGGKYAAGIGSGDSGSCGDITISGGTITATGGNRAAGIGSGSFGKFTSISITSGITRVTATRSNNFSNAPIGKGFNDQGSGETTIKFDNVQIGHYEYDVEIDIWDFEWDNGEPTDNTTYGGLLLTVSPYGNEGGLTWTLTPAP